MSSESKEDATLKSFIDQKIIADEELEAAKTAYATATAASLAATAREVEAAAKSAELEAKLSKAVDMKDVTRAESSSSSKSSSSKTSSKDSKSPRALSNKSKDSKESKESKETKSKTETKAEVKAELKSDKKELANDKETLSKSSKKEIKSEIKSDKLVLKELAADVEVNEETGRPYGLDEVGTIHAPKLGSKLGQIEGEVVPATSRKDAKDLKATDSIPYTIPPKAAPLVKDNKDRFLKATHGKLTNAQKEIIAEVMSSESKEDATLKSFIDQKIIADEELEAAKSASVAAAAAVESASAFEMEVAMKSAELETKLAKALDMKDVTRAESSSAKSIKSSSSKTSSKADRRQLGAEVRREAVPAPKEAPAAKTTVMTPPKKAEAPKEEKKAESPKEEKKDEKKSESPKEEKKGADEKKEVDGGKPVSKKTAKPTVKPTTPPKPTVPPTTKKPSEKKEVLEKKEVKTSPFSRQLSEVRGKVTPSSSSVRGGKGKTEKPVEGPPAPHAAPKGPRQLSAVPVTKDDADPCHDGLSPRCTPPTTKPVEHRSLAGTPTKSPSSGLHKPTWAPSSKPVESTNVDVDTPVATPDTSSEESTVKSVNTNRVAGPKGATKTLAHDGAPSSRRLAGNPTKSPSSGLHKPTWKPSSKPNEHRELINKVEKKDADPCHDGLSPRCTPPTSKPVEHRSLAGSPTKSPSSGLHKPTWKPSSKPNEHRQ